jgi:acetyltransferase-like isoleucine patch superfamily enzyme
MALETIESAEQLANIKDNTIINAPILEKSRVTFNGKGNILYCAQEKINVKNSSITFDGNNGIIFLSEIKWPYHMSIVVSNNAVIYFGKNDFFNVGTQVKIMATERKHVIVGDGCLFSLDIVFRTADPHLIYDSKTHERINQSKSIYIGDHVWLGQHCMILKNTQIGSGSILGAMTVAAGKKIGSNCIYAGNPCRKIKENIFFDSACVHNYSIEQTEKSQRHEQDNYIYQKDENTIEFEEIEKNIGMEKTVEERLTYLIDKVYKNTSKNRFYLGETNATTDK